jgi:hypothetical protein
MATFISKDAVIVTDLTPVDEQANLSYIDTPTQSVLTNRGAASNLTGDVFGYLGLSGGSFSKSAFTFTSDSGKPLIQAVGTKVAGTSITGAKADEKFMVGGPGVEFSDPTLPSDTARIDAKFSSGNDSLRFLNKTTEKSSTYDMGKGEDSIVFGKRSTVSGTTLRLGSDSDADKVRFETEAVTEGVKITQFGKEDELTVGGKTYTYDQIKKLGGNVDGISVQLDQPT